MRWVRWRTLFSPSILFLSSLWIAVPIFPFAPLFYLSHCDFMLRLFGCVCFFLLCCFLHKTISCRPTISYTVLNVATCIAVHGQSSTTEWTMANAVAIELKKKKEKTSDEEKKATEHHGIQFIHRFQMTTNRRTNTTLSAFNVFEIC